MNRRLYRILGTIIDRALNRAWPLEAHTRAYLAMQAVTDAADRLAEAEAAVEVTEPALEPWEQELRDACAVDDCAEDNALAAWERELREALAPPYAPDDLWAAEQRHRTIIDLPPDQTLDDLVRSLRPPADRDDDTAASSRPHRPSPPAGTPVGAATPQQPARGADRDSLADQIATVIAVVLRRHGINSAAIFADIAARELAQHFTFHRR